MRQACDAARMLALLNVRRRRGGGGWRSKEASARGQDRNTTWRSGATTHAKFRTCVLWTFQTVATQTYAMFGRLHRVSAVSTEQLVVEDHRIETTRLVVADLAPSKKLVLLFTPEACAGHSSSIRSPYSSREFSTYALHGFKSRYEICRRSVQSSCSHHPSPQAAPFPFVLLSTLRAALNSLTPAYHELAPEKLAVLER